MGMWCDPRFAPNVMGSRNSRRYKAGGFEMSETSDGRAIDDGVKAVIERVDALLRDREEMDEPDFLFVGVIPTEPRWLVDTAALPAELATKVVAREKAFGSPPPLGPCPPPPPPAPPPP